MTGFISELASAADSESPRSERARASAELIRTEQGYRWVGIYDVDDDVVTLIGNAGERPANEAVRTRATVASGAAVVVPILGAESGIVIGEVEAQREGTGAVAADDAAFLEECAAALRALYD